MLCNVCCNRAMVCCRCCLRAANRLAGPVPAGMDAACAAPGRALGTAPGGVATGGMPGLVTDGMPGGVGIPGAPGTPGLVAAGIASLSYSSRPSSSPFFNYTARPGKSKPTTLISVSAMVSPARTKSF